MSNSIIDAQAEYERQRRMASHDARVQFIKNQNIVIDKEDLINEIKDQLTREQIKHINKDYGKNR